MSLGIVGVGETCFCNRCGYSKPETEFSMFARAQHKAGDENCICLGCVEKLYKGQLTRGEIAGYIAEDRARLLKDTLHPEYAQMVGQGRWGTPMDSSQFILKLEKALGGKIIVGEGYYKDTISLYRLNGMTIDFVCWITHGTMPEYSIAHFNRDKQPIREQRGWRTALLRIIKKGLLTEEQAKKIFKDPTNPIEARFWNKRLWEFRNERTEGQNTNG
jgi:hypothetical protein